MLGWWRKRAAARREFEEYLVVRGTVRLSFDTAADRAKLSDLVAHPGFMPLKAMMMAAALQEVAKHGSKSERAPGLARAVGIISHCEQVREEMALRERAKDAKRTPEEQMEQELAAELE